MLKAEQVTASWTQYGYTSEEADTWRLCLPFYSSAFRAQYGVGEICCFKIGWNIKSFLSEDENRVNMVFHGKPLNQRIGYGVFLVQAGPASKS